ncbi:MAG: nucleoside deaminase [Beijerinckiaceae bacterium]
MPDQKRLAMHVQYLQAAVAVSRNTMESGRGGPFGAVIVKDGVVLAQAGNEVTSSNDPTAHAEVVAIRRACEAVGNFSLRGAVIYASCEPCPMCLAAIYWARLDAVYFANDRHEAAAIGFDDDLIYRELPLPAEQRSLPARHVPLTEAKAVFADWMGKADRVDY